MDDPITISSSDSDIDFEFGSEDEAFSTNERAEGYGEHSGNLLSRSATGSMLSPLNPRDSIHTGDPRNSHSAAGFHFSEPQRKIYSSERQKHPMEKLDKRASPFPFHPYVPDIKHSGLRDSGRPHQTNGSRNYFPFDGPSCSNGKNHENPKFDNDVGGIGNLPPWLHSNPISSGRYASSVDPLDPFRNGDERPGGTDERSVFQEVIQDLNQPKQEADLPDGLLSVPLLRHQKIALAWMRQKEARPFCVGGMLADDQGLGKTISTIALIQMERYSEQKSKSEDHKNCKSLALNLDDDDDNGIVNLDDVKPIEYYNGVKSISSIECSNEVKSVLPIEYSNGVKSNFSKGSSLQQSFSKQRPGAGTLVVCPASVLRQWARELKEKVTEDAKLKVLVYHGGNRTKDPSELASYDVVLTTYAIVANEVPKQPLDEDGDTGEKNGAGTKRKRQSNSSKKGKKGMKGRKGSDSCPFDSDSGTLAKVRWLRVVLDEAQTIKNHRTQVARACCGLRAKKRWCLSGTPIQNTIEELFSYFRFLKYEPYSVYKGFLEGIKHPISRDSKSGYRKLQVVLRTVMLRRTKGTLIDGKPIINLPPKYIKMNSVDLTFEEREFYTKLESDSRIQFKAYAEAGTVNQNYANILLMLLRLRQACDHPLLVCGIDSDSNKKTYSIQTLKQLPKDKLTSLLNCLQGSAICQICYDPPEDAVISICGHVFCDQCVLGHLEGDDYTCPARKCKEQLSTDVIFSKTTLRSCLSDGSESSLSKDDQRDEGLSIYSRDYISSKIRVALEILQSLGKKKASVPCIDLDGSAEDDTLNSDPGVNVRSEIVPCIDIDGSAEDDALISDLDVNMRTAIVPCMNTDGARSSDPAVIVRTEIINHEPSEGRKKAIVFSQWTRMLDLMEESLQRCGMHYRRLDGTMTLNARDKAVRDFNLNPEVDVMLMSLKAGNLGLNMVAACHVIMLDLWWNPTTEDQAIDRAHRIGQTRAVTVSRLAVKDSVEDRILALQGQKRKMVASAFGEENGGAPTRMTAQDLRFLFMGA